MSDDEDDRLDALLGRQRRSDDEPSNLTLQRYLAGELDGDESAALEAHLAESAQTRDRLEQLRDAEADFADDLFVRRLADRTLRAARPPQRRWIWPSLAAAAAVVAVVAVTLQAPGPAPELPGGGPASPGTRLKGGVGLSVVVRHADGRVTQVLPGGRLAPEDTIRFLVSTPGPAHVGVVGMDSARVVSVYHPRGDTLAPVPAGRDQALPGSIILDRTLGPERLIAVFCDSPRTTARLEAAARAALDAAGGDPRAVAELDIDCPQARFTFVKVAP